MNVTNLKPIKSTVIPCIFTLLFILQVPVLAQQLVREGFPHDDFEIREEMVPMRDGVKLYTLILTPKNSGEPLPIILMRTPYDATRALGDRPTSRVAVTLGSKFLGNDYVYVVQDTRGRRAPGRILETVLQYGGRERYAGEVLGKLENPL